MLEVRENEISLRKLSGGAAHLRTLDVTLDIRPCGSIPRRDQARSEM